MTNFIQTSLYRQAPDTNALTHRLMVGGGLVMSVLIFAALLRGLAGFAPSHPAAKEIAVLIHLIAVTPAVPLGLYLLIRRKGDRRHKVLGRLWLLLMVVTALSALFIRHINQGGFSFIHLFVPLTLVSAWQIIASARAGKIVEHRKQIVGLYLGALLIPGAFAFAPGRLMSVLLLG